MLKMAGKLNRCAQREFARGDYVVMMSCACGIVLCGLEAEHARCNPVARSAFGTLNVVRFQLPFHDPP